jgi:hypothetical protein
MGMTPEEKAKAQSDLDEAVDRFISLNGWNKGQVVTGWVLVAASAGYDEQGAAISSHPIAYMGGSLPDHIALGMFQIASDTVRGVGRWARAEDDDDEETL